VLLAGREPARRIRLQRPAVRADESDELRVLGVVHESVLAESMLLVLPNESWHEPRCGRYSDRGVPSTPYGNMCSCAAIKQEALALVAAGVNDCEIARRLGVARTTIRDWRNPRHEARAPVAVCPRCWESARPVIMDACDYAELLGLYLGDGCISHHPRTTRLRISLDAKYPKVVANTQVLLRRSFIENRVGRSIFDDGHTVVVHVYSQHLECLFPQHGPGKKHERPIVLESWQSRLVEKAPWRFLRGCIWSDGCAFINRTDPYEYLSCDFGNLSQDILELVEWAYGLVGVQCRRAAKSVRVNRRDSVALSRRTPG
jgi:hypothetical protein